MEGIRGRGLDRWFESTNCTGQAWIEGREFNVIASIAAYASGVTVALTGIRTFYVSDPSDNTPQMIFRRSLEQNGNGCEPAVAQVSAIRLIPVDLDSMFTPPFRVTTWERMQAQP